ncbi:MAG: hypothetical protein Q9198_003235 [Flavoplaca austrocitrina]
MIFKGSDSDAELDSDGPKPMPEDIANKNDNEKVDGPDVFHHGSHEDPRNRDAHGSREEGSWKEASVNRRNERRESDEEEFTDEGDSAETEHGLGDSSESNKELSEGEEISSEVSRDGETGRVKVQNEKHSKKGLATKRPTQDPDLDSKRMKRESDKEGRKFRGGKNIGEETSGALEKEKRRRDVGNRNPTRSVNKSAKNEKMNLMPQLGKSTDVGGRKQQPREEGLNR